MEHRSQKAGADFLPAVLQRCEPVAVIEPSVAALTRATLKGNSDTPTATEPPDSSLEFVARHVGASHRSVRFSRLHDRAGRRRRARRGQHLRGSVRRLEARRPQSLVGHRLQPSEPRRRGLRPPLWPHRRDVRDDGLARRHLEIWAAPGGGLCGARRAPSARMDRRLPELALFGAGLQGR